MTQKDEDFDEAAAKELKEAVEKRLVEELAAINASNLSRTELALRLAESRVFSQLAKSVTELRREQSSVLAGLIPKAFEEGKKTFAKAGASAAHAENRAIKQDVFAWLDANPPRPRGKSAAATAIAGKVAPVVFTTALKWVNEWEKLHSTGTP